MNFARLLFGIVIGPLVVACQCQTVSNEKEAADLVQGFMRFDFEGYRLDSKGHQAIWDLTIEDGAAPEFPIVVVDRYRVLKPAKVSADSLRVSVEYDVIGFFGEGTKGVYFKAHRHTRKDVFPVQCAPGGCRIDLNRDLFHVSPRVGKRATLSWLKVLESIQDTEPEKRKFKSLLQTSE